MVAVLKRGDDKSRMRRLLEEIRKRGKQKGVAVQKYCGTIKLKDDALSIQKKLRDEWD